MGYLKKGPRIDLNFHENELQGGPSWWIYAWFCLLIFFSINACSHHLWEKLMCFLFSTGEVNENKLLHYPFSTYFLVICRQRIKRYFLDNFSEFWQLNYLSCWFDPEYADDIPLQSPHPSNKFGFRISSGYHHMIRTYSVIPYTALLFRCNQ